jgi:hypothetical protein
LEAVYLGALDAVDKIADHKAAAIKSKKFTADGVNADALQFAINNLVPTFKRGRNAIANARQEAAALRDKIKLQPLEKGDVVGFLQRQEIRDRLWEMTPEARGKYLARNIDRLDPTIALAVLEMPADMSPAPDSVHCNQRSAARPLVAIERASRSVANTADQILNRRAKSVGSIN